MSHPITGPDDRSPADAEVDALLGELVYSAREIGICFASDQIADAYEAEVAQYRERILSALRSARRDAATVTHLAHCPAHPHNADCICASSPPILEKNDREDAPGERAPGLPPSSPDGETSNETVRIGRLKCYNCGKPKSDPIHKDNFECFFEAISSSTPPSYDS